MNELPGSTGNTGHTGLPPPVEREHIHTRRVVSRHLWRGDGYEPPRFEQYPPIGPG